MATLTVSGPRVAKPQLFVGIPVRLRAMVRADGTVMWSADAVMDDSGNGYVGTGDSPAAAYAALAQTLAFHAQPED